MLNPKFSFAYTYDISVGYRVNLLKDRGRWHVGTGDESLGPDLIQVTVGGLHGHQVPRFQLAPVREDVKAEASVTEPGNFISTFPNSQNCFGKYANS